MGPVPEQFTGDTLTLADDNPSQDDLARATIARYAFDDDDRQRLDETVFGTPRKARFHGDKPSPEWAQARTAWLGRCRDWVQAETGRVLTTAQIPTDDQRAYTAATGDAWQAPEAAPAPPKEPKTPRERATIPMVDAEPARRHVQALTEHGMRQRDICEAAGISGATLGALLHGRYELGRPTQQTIHADTAEQLLTVRFQDPPRRRPRPAQCGPGMQYEPAGFRVGRCGECGLLVATHITRGGQERLMSHPSAGAEDTAAEVAA